MFIICSILILFYYKCFLFEKLTFCHTFCIINKKYNLDFFFFRLTVISYTLGLGKHINFHTYIQLNLVSLPFMNAFIVHLQKYFLIQFKIFYCMFNMIPNLKVILLPLIPKWYQGRQC